MSTFCSSEEDDNIQLAWLPILPKSLIGFTLVNENCDCISTYFTADLTVDF